MGDGVARGHGAEGDVRQVWSELRTESAMTPTQVEKLDAERVPPGIACDARAQRGRENRGVAHGRPG